MERLELTVSRLRLPRALLRREPYFVALAVPQFGSATDVRTVPFPRVNRAHDLTFDPPFVLLSVPDPGSRVAISVAIMESDAGFRAAGARVDVALEKLKRGSVGHLLTKGSAVASLGAALQVASGLVAAVAKYLTNNGDDVLGVLELVVDVPLVENGVARKFSSSFAEMDYGISISRSSVVSPEDEGANRLTVATSSTAEPLSLEELAALVQPPVEFVPLIPSPEDRRFSDLVREVDEKIAAGYPKAASNPVEKRAVGERKILTIDRLSDEEIDARAVVEEPPPALPEDDDLSSLLIVDEKILDAPPPAKPGFLGRRHRK